MSLEKWRNWSLFNAIPKLRLTQYTRMPKLFGICEPCTFWATYLKISLSSNLVNSGFFRARHTSNLKHFHIYLMRVLANLRLLQTVLPATKLLLRSVLLSSLGQTHRNLLYHRHFYQYFAISFAAWKHTSSVLMHHVHTQLANFTYSSKSRCILTSLGHVACQTIFFLNHAEHRALKR